MEKEMEQKTDEKKKEIKILGISLWEILAYFIIYSIAGFFIETCFALIAYGVLESRQSFVYGPFCSIYGIGAVVMIIFLQYFNKNRATLFVGGFIIGSITEYLVSLIGELILHVKWWDYSNMPFNLNGRICFAYSMFWGILAIILMKVVHPRVKKLMSNFLNKHSAKFIKTLILGFTLFIIIDCVISAYAINLFTFNMIAKYNLDVINKEIIYKINDNFNESKFSSTMRNTLFTDKKMIRTYPNLKVQQLDGSIVYFKDLLPDIKPYYIKFSSKNFYK